MTRDIPISGRSLNVHSLTSSGIGAIVVGAPGIF